MLESQLKKKIRENDFLEKVRDFQIDPAAFSDLCNCLQELSKVWKGENRIDKELAADLYVLGIVTERMERAMRDKGITDSDVVADMAQELDRLVLDCFNPSA
jgi:hypothetical protein